MQAISYSALFGVDHERDYEEHIAEGDMVSTGRNAGPYFNVLAVNGDRAWVRNITTAIDGIVDLKRCRKVNGAPAPQFAVAI
jgi:hypothetical protein